MAFPLYLVDFSRHKNRVAIPWQRQWFRGEWIVPAGDRTPKPVATEGELMAASGAAKTITRGVDIIANAKARPLRIRQEPGHCPGSCVFDALRYAFASAWSRSATRSLAVSRPTDRRT